MSGRSKKRVGPDPSPATYTESRDGWLKLQSGGRMLPGGSLPATPPWSRSRTPQAYSLPPTPSRSRKNSIYPESSSLRSAPQRTPPTFGSLLLRGPPQRDRTSGSAPMRHPPTRLSRGKDQRHPLAARWAAAVLGRNEPVHARKPSSAPPLLVRTYRSMEGRRSIDQFARDAGHCLAKLRGCRGRCGAPPPG